MRNKKGFSLVELLTVIMVLGLITLITIPIITETVEKNKQKTLESKYKSIEKIAKEYLLNNSNLLNTEGNITIQLSTLITDGYLTQEELINPIDKSQIEGCVLVTVLNDIYKYEYKKNCVLN